MPPSRPQDTELSQLQSGPPRLTTERDFQTEEQICFGDIDFDLYAESESEPERSGIHGPYGMDQSRLLTPEGETLLFRRLSFLTVRASALKSTLQNQRASTLKLKEINALEEQAQQTRNEIAQANLRLVASVARRLSKSPDDFDEMYAEGNTILLYAINKFDYTRGYRFSTYLTHAVQRHLFRLLKRRASRSQREQMGNQEQLAEVPSRTNSDAELSPAEELAIAQKIIESIPHVLDEREQLIVRGRLGLDKTRQPQTFQFLGDQLGLSKERTRQLFQRAIEKLEQSAAPYARLFE